MRKNYVSIAFVIVLLAFSTAAWADACGGIGSTDLTFANFNGGTIGTLGTVHEACTYNSAQDRYQLTFTFTSGTITPNGIREVGWNYSLGNAYPNGDTTPGQINNAPFKGITSPDTTINSAQLSATEDGFGLFNVAVNFDGNKDNTVTLFLSPFASNSVTFSDFVAHVAWLNGATDCSGWVSTKSTTSFSSGGVCSGGQVPEPGSFGLLATGLLSLGGLATWRLRR